METSWDRTNDLGTWYVALGMWTYQICSNDDPKLTYLTSRSNLLPIAFEWDFFFFFWKS